MKKVLLLLFGFNLILHAQCFYDLHIDFDFKAKKIIGKAFVYNNQQSLTLNTDTFFIHNGNELKKSIKDGANKISFTFEKNIPHLNEQFIYLLDNWYPSTHTPCQYKVQSSLPSEYTAIYEKTKKPINALNFIASKAYVQHSQQYKNITIHTYFLNNNKKLAQQYLNKTIEYIKLFEKNIAPFPFKQFSVVESNYQTGYSMPTFTLIGSRLLHKPYILNQSLAHEIMHQYFGNSVTIDFKQGNWIEGLTTFLADDYLKALNNSDIEHRKSVLTQYTHFINENNEFPINAFEYRKDKASMLIGYSKLSFVFHMLKNKIGAKQFDALIKKLYITYTQKQLNFEQVLEFFNSHTQEDLNPFFKQWVYQKGMIDFTVSDISNDYNNDGFTLTFKITQQSKHTFTFTLPIHIQTYDKTMHTQVLINKKVQTVRIKTQSQVLHTTFDKNIDLFRKLSNKEQQLSFASVLNEDKLLAVVNAEKYEQYQWIQKLFTHIQILKSNTVTFENLKNNTIIFLDKDNDVLQHIYPQNHMDTKTSYMHMKPHAYNKDKTMMVLHDGLHKSRYFLMMKYYSKYKKVQFSNTTIYKTLHSTDNGIIKILHSIPNITKTKKPNTLRNIAKELEDKKIVYVGESHDNFTHHLNQLRIIKALHQNNNNIVIAMEMFQTPFQKSLDDYIAGKSSLNSFLKQSEYFKRWKFDYNLYRPIIDYAKTHKIPIVALNIDRDITRQVGRNGLLSLNKEEQKLLPTSIDQSNGEYKQALEDIFANHGNLNTNGHSNYKPNIDFFYQSQLIWDEIMAQNIHAYLKNNPEKTMIVIAGSGHIENHYGIPLRVFKKNNLPYQVILNDMPSSILGDISITNHTTFKLPQEKRLGVYLRTTKALVVEKTIPDSFAHTIGLQKEDILLQINNTPIKSVYDIKHILYFVKDMNAVTVLIKRENKELTLPLKK